VHTSHARVQRTAQRLQDLRTAYSGSHVCVRGRPCVSICVEYASCVVYTAYVLQAHTRTHTHTPTHTHTHERCCHERCCHERCCHERCCHERCCHERCCHERCGVRAARLARADTRHPTPDTRRPSMPIVRCGVGGGGGGGARLCVAAAFCGRRCADARPLVPATRDVAPRQMDAGAGAPPPLHRMDRRTTAESGPAAAAPQTAQLRTRRGAGGRESEGGRAREGERGREGRGEARGGAGHRAGAGA
jgi:hypothetical protein